MIYIWVRATTTWQDEQEFLAQLDPRVKPKVDLWNDTFDIPFHLFRHRVREIARLNQSRVENSACARWEEIPEGGLVVPIDDDDWLAPDIGNVLEDEYDSRATGYHWIRTFIEVPIDLRHRLGVIRRSVFPRTPPRYFCMTNNYALVKAPETKPLLESHSRASEWFEVQERGRVRKIERHLSAMNRTLASKTSLGGKPSPTRSTFIRKFHAYRRLYRRLARAPVGPGLALRRGPGKVYGRPSALELAWCRPYLAMMSDLMDQLGIREHSPPPPER